MIAYFAVGDGGTARRLLSGHAVLMSYAYVGTKWIKEEDARAIASGATRTMLDSGAFTAWRKGTEIRLEDYRAWLADEAPTYDWAVTLDVIGDAGASLRNWRQLRADKIVPVFHEGDPWEHLDEYVDGAGLVAVGRIEGRASKEKTLIFYDAIFNRHPSAQLHALGNAGPDTLEPYPFASFDSTGWQRDAAYSNAAKWPYNRCSKETRMSAYIEATETITHRPPKQLRLVGI